MVHAVAAYTQSPSDEASLGVFNPTPPPPPQPGWEANVLVRSPGISPCFLRYPCLLQGERDGESKAFGQLKSLAK